MTKSNEQKTPIIIVSIKSIAIRKSLSLFLIVLLTEIIQSGVIKDVPSNSKIMGYPAKSLKDFIKENK